MVDKAKILEGRKAVNTYREAHRVLHGKPWHKGVPKEHRPLLENLLAKLKKLGFNSLQEFSTASETLGDEWR